MTVQLGGHRDLFQNWFNNFRTGKYYIIQYDGISVFVVLICFIEILCLVLEW